MFDAPKISSLQARPVVLPLARPLRTASGTVPASPLLLLDITTEDGVVGHSYVFGYTDVTMNPMRLLAESIAPLLIGRTLAPGPRLSDLYSHFRLLGVHGLVGMVLSGLEVAMWDALGKRAQLPVVELLGGEPKALRTYDSWGVVDPRSDEKAMRTSIEGGFTGVKIKLGSGDLANDVAMVRWTRNVIGPNATLMVDYNQSLDVAEALRRIPRLEEFDLYWIEEPVVADDLVGHSRVRDASRISIQSGENWWYPATFAQAATAHATDAVMIDLIKGGGVSGWMQTAAIARADSLRVSSHMFAEASSHLLAITPTADWLEYLDIAGPVLLQPVQQVGGFITPQGPGFGIEWDERAVSRYAF